MLNKNFLRDSSAGVRKPVVIAIFALAASAVGACAPINTTNGHLSSMDESTSRMAAELEADREYLKVLTLQLQLMQQDLNRMATDINAFTLSTTRLTNTMTTLLESPLLKGFLENLTRETPDGNSGDIDDDFESPGAPVVLPPLPPIGTPLPVSTPTPSLSPLPIVSASPLPWPSMSPLPRSSTSPRPSASPMPWPTMSPMPTPSYSPWPSPSPTRAPSPRPSPTGFANRAR